MSTDTDTADLELEDELETRGFTIDGTEYPIPALSSFDMDEAQILYDTCRLTIEDFVPLGEFDGDLTDENAVARFEEIKDAHERRLEENVKNPSFLRALIHVAYRRGNPKLPEGRIRDVVAKTNHVSAMADFYAVTVALQRKGDPRVPPASATEPQPRSSGNSDASSASSGTDSRSDSVAPEETPDRIGTTRSLTSAT